MRVCGRVCGKVEEYRADSSQPLGSGEPQVKRSKRLQSCPSGQSYSFNVGGRPVHHGGGDTDLGTGLENRSCQQLVFSFLKPLY